MDLLMLERSIERSDDARAIIEVVDAIVGKDPETGMSFEEAIMASHEDVLLAHLFTIDTSTAHDAGFVLACVHEYIATVEVIAPETDDSRPTRTLYLLSQQELDRLMRDRGDWATVVQLNHPADAL